MFSYDGLILKSAQNCKAVEFLLQSTNINVNAVNAMGQTALDILYMRDGSTIGQALRSAGALFSTVSPPANPKQQENSNENPLHKFIKEKQEAVMITASLIAAIAFQAAINPPGGVYQDSKINGTDVNSTHMAGFSVVAYKNPSLYRLFAVENSIGFVASIFVFLLLLTGLPFKYKSFSSVLMVSIWVSIVAVAASFFSSLITVAPPFEYGKVLAIAIGGLVVSVVLWVLIILWYVGFGPKLVGFIRNRKGKRRSTTETTPIAHAPTV